MTTTAEVLAPDVVHISITITAPLKEWKDLMEELPPTDHPSYILRKQIAEVVQKVSQTFHAAQE